MNIYFTALRAYSFLKEKTAKHKQVLDSVKGELSHLRTMER